MKRWMVGALVLMSLTLVAGCSAKSKDEPTQVAIESEEEEAMPLRVKEKRVVIEGDWLFMEYVATETPWLYFEDMYAIPEVGQSNEGGARLNQAEGLLTFSFLNKAPDQYLFAEVSVADKEVVQREENGDWSALSDERIVEIGNLFLDIFHAQTK